MIPEHVPQVFSDEASDYRLLACHVLEQALLDLNEPGREKRNARCFWFSPHQDYAAVRRFWVSASGRPLTKWLEEVYANLPDLSQRRAPHARRASV